MADLRLSMTYTISLSSAELTLVQRALRNTSASKDMDESERAAALTLQEALLLQKAKVLEQASHEADKARVNIENHRKPEPGTGG
jgi:hypothetical protein